MIIPRRRALLASLFCLVVAAAAFSPRFALAHAQLMESIPAVNAALKGGDFAVSLRFNSRVDHHRSLLTLIDADHVHRTLPIVPDSPDDVLASRAQIGPGRYTLRWQVLAIDGHITRGDVPFTVLGE